MEAREGGMRAPAPQLPPPRQDVLGAGVVTPPRREADRHGGICAPGTRLLQKGTRVSPQIFTEVRDKDSGPDRRNVPWSPENVLIDTAVRLQRDLAAMKAESHFLRTLGAHLLCRLLGRLHSRQRKYHGSQARPAGSSTVAIVLSNGWDDATAALQLLSHLGGGGVGGGVHHGSPFPGKELLQRLKTHLCRPT